MSNTPRYKSFEEVNEIGDRTWYAMIPAPGGRRFLVKTLHREDGPAIITARGTKKWYHYGDLHREDDLPAIENEGYCIWFYKGKRHRLTGPSYIGKNGVKEFCIDGVEYPEVEYYRRIKLINFS